MRQLLLLSFSICAFTLHANKLPDLRALFIALPDTVFTHESRCFNEQDSFPVKERVRLLNRFDSSLTSFRSDSGIRFWITEADDSIQRVSFTQGEKRVSLTIHSRAKKEIFFSIRSEACDFVVCNANWRFFTFFNGRLKEVYNVLPENFSIGMFFDHTYLKNMNVDPAIPMVGIGLSLTGDVNFIELSVNTDYFDPELFGDSLYTKLDASKIIHLEYQLMLKGKEFELIELE